MIIDEELKLKRLQTTEADRRRASIKNRWRNRKILAAQKDFAIGRLVSKNLVFLSNTKYVLLHIIFYLLHIILTTYNILFTEYFFIKSK